MGPVAPNKNPLKASKAYATRVAVRFPGSNHSAALAFPAQDWASFATL